MRHNDVHVVGLGVELGQLVPSRVALADGRFSADDAAKTGQVSVSCSDRTATELAAAAGRKAVQEARGAGIDIDSRLALHLHASVCAPGIEVWSASCHVLGRLTGPGPLMSLHLNAVSNGCLAALELAAQVMAGADADACALVTTADSFTEPEFPRWSTERGMVFGDGATAAVLARRPGIAALLSTASFTDPTMEGLHRGNEQVVGGGRPHLTPIDLRGRSRAHLAQVGGPATVSARHLDVLAGVIGRALDDAEVKADDLARVVLPFFGRQFIEREYLEPFGFRSRDTLLDLGLTVGHLGAGDQLVGLDHLRARGEVGPGDLVLLIGVGAGFTWTTAVVRIE
ncbi:ketoacyl-ACP synthase III family protein [Actinosynnema sp. NPDC050436]|uniref:ketoacyl-ACP synthase III family protein n=1 Tax=Actinosynnema sp. NPDC050436 TaxID=3155659 RepID=UPI0033EA7FA2